MDSTSIGPEDEDLEHIAFCAIPRVQPSRLSGALGPVLQRECGAAGARQAQLPLRLFDHLNTSLARYTHAPSMASQTAVENALKAHELAGSLRRLLARLGLQGKVSFVWQLPVGSGTATTHDPAIQALGYLAVLAGSVGRVGLWALRQHDNPEVLRYGLLSFRIAAGLFMRAHHRAQAHGTGGLPVGLASLTPTTLANGHRLVLMYGQLAILLYAKALGRQPTSLAALALGLVARIRAAHDGYASSPTAVGMRRVLGLLVAYARAIAWHTLALARFATDPLKAGERLACARAAHAEMQKLVKQPTFARCLPPVCAAYAATIAEWHTGLDTENRTVYFAHVPQHHRA